MVNIAVYPSPERDRMSLGTWLLERAGQNGTPGSETPDGLSWQCREKARARYRWDKRVCSCHSPALL